MSTTNSNAMMMDVEMQPLMLKFERRRLRTTLTRFNAAKESVLVNKHQAVVLKRRIGVILQTLERVPDPKPTPKLMSIMRSAIELFDILSCPVRSREFILSHFTGVEVFASMRERIKQAWQLHSTVRWQQEDDEAAAQDEEDVLRIILKMDRTMLPPMYRNLSSDADVEAMYRRKSKLSGWKVPAEVVENQLRFAAVAHPPSKHRGGTQSVEGDVDSHTCSIAEDDAKEYSACSPSQLSFANNPDGSSPLVTQSKQDFPDSPLHAHQNVPGAFELHDDLRYSVIRSACLHVRRLAPDDVTPETLDAFVQDAVVRFSWCHPNVAAFHGAYTECLVSTDSGFVVDASPQIGTDAATVSNGNNVSSTKPELVLGAIESSIMQPMTFAGFGSSAQAHPQPHHHHQHKSQSQAPFSWLSHVLFSEKRRLPLIDCLNICLHVADAMQYVLFDVAKVPQCVKQAWLTLSPEFIAVRLPENHENRRRGSSSSNDDDALHDELLETIDVRWYPHWFSEKEIKEAKRARLETCGLWTPPPDAEDPACYALTTLLVALLTNEAPEPYQVGGSTKIPALIPSAIQQHCRKGFARKDPLHDDEASLQKAKSTGGSSSSFFSSLSESISGAFESAAGNPRKKTGGPTPRSTATRAPKKGFQEFQEMRLSLLKQRDAAQDLWSSPQTKR